MGLTNLSTKTNLSKESSVAAGYLQVLLLIPAKLVFTICQVGKAPVVVAGQWEPSGADGHTIKGCMGH